MYELRCWYTPVFEDVIDPSTDIEREAIARCIKDLTKSVKSEKVSNLGGWQSPSYHRGDIVQFESILDKIQHKINLIGQQFKINLSISSYWINVNYKGNSNIHHTHPNSVFSGVVYLDASVDQGSLRIIYPSKDVIQYGLSTLQLNSLSDLYNDVIIDPKTNKIIIFPSYVPHSVNDNVTDRPRVSLAFNTAYSSKQSTP